MSRCVLCGHKRTFVFMERYSEITQKQKREIVLLRGKGCAYKRCAFCDYHLDSDADAGAAFTLNASVLSRVTGMYGELEVINSGSVFELDALTLDLIRSVCRSKGIKVLHFESHYMYKNMIPALRRDFGGIALKLKLGLETFDRDFREDVLKKGIPESDPAAIAKGFDEANFLFGLAGQTAASMKRDMELGLTYFERICVNLMNANSTPVRPDAGVTEEFMRDVYPLYIDDPRVDILVQNTDFGVGA